MSEQVQLETPTKRVWIIGTHDGCRDGHVAQVIARKYYEENPPVDENDEPTTIVYWRFNPSRREEGLERLWKYCSDNNYLVDGMYCFDVAFGPKHLNDMILHCNVDAKDGEVKIFDHHVTSKREFSVTETVMVSENYIYDEAECGATLAWKLYYPDKPIPRFLEYIKDRDLWKTEAENSLAVNEYLFASTPSFTEPHKWFKYFEMSEEEEKSFYDNAAEAGELLMKLKQNSVERISAGGKVQKMGDYSVYVVNSPTLQSDIGNYCVNKKDLEGDYICDYAIVWRYNEPSETYYVSFRSRGDVDVSLIAKQYNGGGHNAASGCELKNITDLLSYMHINNSNSEEKENIDENTEEEDNDENTVARNQWLLQRLWYRLTDMFITVNDGLMMIYCA